MLLVWLFVCEKKLSELRSLLEHERIYKRWC